MAGHVSGVGTQGVHTEFGGGTSSETMSLKMTAGMLRRVVSYRFTDVSVTLTACNILIIELINTYGTSVNFYETARRSVPDDSRPHAHRRENLKSYRYL